MFLNVDLLHGVLHLHQLPRPHDLLQIHLLLSACLSSLKDFHFVSGGRVTHGDFDEESVNLGLR